MDLNSFRERVHQQLGPYLEKATGDDIRKFVREIEAERRREPPAKRRYLLSETPPETVDQIFRGFFHRVLDMEKEEAVIALWLMAADLAFSDNGE